MKSVKKLEYNQQERFFLRTGAIALTCVGAIILVTFLSFTYVHFNLVRGSETMSMTTSGAFGDFIAGFVGTLFSLVGVLLLFLTLREQRDSFHRERLENKFFELIKFHRDNVNELTFDRHRLRIKSPDDPSKLIRVEPNVIEGRRVFNQILGQFLSVYEELEPFFTDKKIDNICLDNYRKMLDLNPTIKERNIPKILLCRIDICYTIIFFGIGGMGFDICRTLLANRYKSSFTDKILNYLRLKPIKSSSYWQHWLRTQKIYQTMSAETLDRIFSKRKKYTKYYNGNQFRLGHYFRHLFSSVNFIDQEPLLSFEEKYNYIKLLRGQMSTHEQIIFFINSLSQIGERWELNPEGNNSNRERINKQLITKYCIIKNIPDFEIAPDFQYRIFYPNVQFETLSSSERLRVEKSRESLISYFR